MSIRRIGGPGLGTLGMSGPPGTVYTSDDIAFLRLVGRVVAFAIDDNFNLRQAEAARAELQRQNEKLERSERELRDVIEAIPSMAWSAAADGGAEFFNRRWLDYAGLTADQAQGWGWTTAVHPDDLKVLVEYWQGMLALASRARSKGVYAVSTEYTAGFCFARLRHLMSAEKLSNDTEQIPILNYEKS